MIRDLDEYRIVLKYYQAGVLADTRNTVFPIANEDDLSLTLGRNEQFEGVFQEFSGTFIFCLSDRDWIIEKRNDYLSRLDAETKLIIEFYQLNTTTLMYDLSYTGRLEFKNLSLPDYYIECQFYEDNLINKLNRIQDTQITVEKDGEEYDYNVKLNAVYDAKADNTWSGKVVITEDYTYNPISITEEGAADNPFSESENDNSLALENMTRFTNESGRAVLKITNPAQVQKLILSNGFGASVFFDTDGTFDLTNVSVRLYYDYYKYNTFVNRTLISSAFVLSDMSAGTTSYCTNFSEISKDISSVPVNRISTDIDDWSRLELIAEIDAETTDATSCTFMNISVYLSAYELVGTIPNQTYEERDFKCRLDFGTTERTSKITAHEFRDVLDDYEELLGIDINTDALTGTVYENMLLTTSRGVKGIKPLNYNIQFNTLFNSLKSFMALSLEEGTDTVYLKPISDAYDDSEIIDLGELTDLEIVQSDKIYNTLTIGNSGGGSSNFDYGDLDPLAQATYDLGLDDETKKTFENDVRVDAATINKAAIDFEKVTTSIADRDEDKDLYLIAYDPSESTIRSNFSVVSGLDNEKFGQGINLEFTKSRQLYNWRNYLGHLFTPNSEYTLKSWDKNADLVYTDSDRGVDVTDTPDAIMAINTFISNGVNNYVNLDVLPDNDTVVKMRFKQMYTTSGAIVFFGTRSATTYDDFIFQTTLSGNYIAQIGSENINTGILNNTDEHAVELSSDGLTLDGVFYEATIKDVGNIVNDLLLFAFNNNDTISFYSEIELISFDIYNGNELISSVKAKDRDSTNLYDSVRENNLQIYGDVTNNQWGYYGQFDRSPIFGASIYNTELPITTEIKSKIYNNKNKIFKFAFKGNDYYGYFDNGEYNPLLQEGGSFKFIQAAI